jgi:hypothetical protein
VSSAACIRASVARVGSRIAAPESAADDGATPILNTTLRATTATLDDEWLEKQ